MLVPEANRGPLRKREAALTQQSSGSLQNLLTLYSMQRRPLENAQMRKNSEHQP